MIGATGLARLEAIVHGRVQGVGFRFFVLATASRLELVGWVANRPDGLVECVAEGARPQLEAFLKALEEGPPGARVANVTTAWLPSSGGFDRFAIRSGGHGGD